MFARVFRRAAPLAALIPAHMIGRVSVAEDHAEPEADSVVLVVDIGSSSVRCSAFDTKARMLPQTLRREKLSLSHTGTMDASQIKECTASVISQCLNGLREMPRPPRVLAVGMDSFAMSWLAVDRSGSAISEVFTYADARAAPFAAAIRMEVGDAGEKLLWNKTGTPIHTSYALAQHRRMLEEQPAICSSAATFQTLGAHLVGTWTGRGAAMPVSFSEASWTGLLGTPASCSIVVVAVVVVVVVVVVAIAIF